ncbi:MAG: serine hydroxymethyltransferase [Pseudomonadota bacterium]|nr:serine hydroxymethyltransferase [Pseudomonadota bacterium]
MTTDLKTENTAKPWQRLHEADHELYALCEQELTRQRQGLELIASENFAPSTVITALANVFMNKYAEGLPAKRYYGGCSVTDDLECLAIERAKKLFNSSYANVQPHSGAQANAAALMALASPNDKILALDLAHGGHLTHGSAVNFSGRFYQSHFYGVCDRSGILDYERIAACAKEVQPQVIIAGASAYSRCIDFQKFHHISKEVGAYLLVDMAHIAGLVAAGVHPSPLPWADVVTTTTHKTLRGPRSGLMLWNNADLSTKLNKGVFPGTQGGPMQHVIVAKALCFKEAMHSSFVEYQRQTIANAKALAAEFERQGLAVLTGGTDNHLVLLDLSATKFSGKFAEQVLESAAISVNKNMIPGDKRSPMITSGVRIGTPAVTTRGMREQEMVTIATFIQRALENANNADYLVVLKHEVEAFAANFPLYPEW